MPKLPKIRKCLKLWWRCAPSFILLIIKAPNRLNTHIDKRNEATGVGYIKSELYTKLRVRRLSILYHPHPASPVEGEEHIFPPQAGGIEGGGLNGIIL